MRNGGGRETNNQLRGIGAARAEMSKIKAGGTSFMIDSNKGLDQSVSERLVDAMGEDSKSTSANQLLGVSIVVAWHTFTSIAREDGDLNPAFRGLRKIIGNEESGEMRQITIKVVKMKGSFANG